MNNADLMAKIIVQLKSIFPQGESVFAKESILGQSSEQQIKNYMEQLEIGLTENHLLTPTLIKQGFKKMRLRPSSFFPSVGEFVDACMPTAADNGLPSPDEAYRLAAQSATSESKHKLEPMIYNAAKGLWQQLEIGRASCRERV